MEPSRGDSQSNERTPLHFNEKALLDNQNDKWRKVAYVSQIGTNIAAGTSFLLHDCKAWWLIPAMISLAGQAFSLYAISKGFCSKGQVPVQPHPRRAEIILG